MIDYQVILANRLMCATNQLHAVVDIWLNMQAMIKRSLTVILVEYVPLVKTTLTYVLNGDVGYDRVVVAAYLREQLTLLKGCL
jgi:hypothetical protein